MSDLFPGESELSFWMLPGDIRRMVELNGRVVRIVQADRTVA